MIRKIEQRLYELELSDDQRKAVKGVVQETVDDVVTQLREMISRWESMQLESDTSLYTLGILRSIDLVTGESFLDQLPVLETEDTPDE